MSEHQHQQITPGCYRCDLNLDELRDFLRDQFALGGTSGSDPLYDDVHEAWEAFDGSMEQLLAAEKAKWQAEALREAVRDMRTARRKSWTWTLPDPLDPEAAYSVDTWLEIRANRIEKGGNQ